jgi:beta-glucoside PTS system EIICBA component
MGSVDFRSLAGDIVEQVGGVQNIASATHCATRLRLRLKDEDKADKAAVEKLPGVITVMRAGGQFQVVIGNDVPQVYSELSKITGTTDDTAVAPSSGNLLNRFIDLVSSLIQPLLWPIAGAGLFKALLSLFTQLGWLDPTSQSYTVLAAAADSVFYFLPILLAVTASKRFRADQFTSMAIAGAMLYPSIIALGTSADIHFFGIPLVLMSYASSVIPILVAVWIQGYLERALKKALPSAIRNFTVPLLTLLVMVPLVLITVGPVTTWIANGVSSGINSVFTFAPWLAGGLMGGFWQVFVLFGLHWGFVPLMANEIATEGYSLLLGPLFAAVIAQSAAALAVFLRTRNQARRAVAGPAAFSGFLAGVTEPAIYGVNLPLRRPFYFGLAGGAVGGAIAAAGGSAASAFVFPSLLGLSATTTIGNFTLQVIGCGAAAITGFTLTWLFVDREHPSADTDVDATPESHAVNDVPVGGAGTAVLTRTVELIAPVGGRVITLAEVPDKVFASGALGHGIGLISTDSRVLAPIEGTVVTAMASGHAYGIKSDQGVEVLVHIGIDTVQLNGRGFTPAVERGQRVRPGDLLAEVDLNVINEAGYDPTTVLVVTNTAQLTSVETSAVGTVEQGRPVLTVEI